MKRFRKITAFFISCILLISAFAITASAAPQKPLPLGNWYDSAEDTTYYVINNPNQTKITVSYSAQTADGTASGTVVLNTGHNIIPIAGNYSISLSLTVSGTNIKSGFFPVILDMKSSPAEGGTIYIVLDGIRYDKIKQVDLINVFHQNTFSFTAEANEGYTVKEIIQSGPHRTYQTAVFEKNTENPDIPPEITGSFQHAYFYGYTDITAAPENNVTIEEASAMLYRILLQSGEITFRKPTSGSFKDIPASHWSFSALEFMKQAGAVTPDSFGNANAHLPASRAAVAKMMSLSFGISPKNNDSMEYTDIDTSDENYTYIKALTDHGILNGYGDGTIQPNEPISRAEIVKMINVLIGRTADYDISDAQILFNDIDGHWAYEDIVRANNAFSDARGDDGLYHIDPEKKADRGDLDQ